MSQSGSYYVVAYSTSTSPGNAALSENIIKQTWCYHTVSLSVPTSYPTSYTYQIYTGSPYYLDYLPKFTAIDSSGDTCTDATFMYSYKFSSNGSSIQSPWSGSSFGADINLQSLTEIDAGTYTFTIFGELTQDTYINGSAQFTITATNPCTAETVTATNPSNGLYYLSDATPLSLGFSSYFTNSDNPSCERTYAIYSDSSCTTLANTTLFGFSNSTG